MGTITITGTDFTIGAGPLVVTMGTIDPGTFKCLKPTPPPIPRLSARSAAGSRPTGTTC